LDWSAYLLQLLWALDSNTPGPDGHVGFTSKEYMTLYHTTRIYTGLAKDSSRSYNPVSGQKRRELEELGFTTEMGFFPERPSHQINDSDVERIVDAAGCDEIAARAALETAVEESSEDDDGEDVVIDAIEIAKHVLKRRLDEQRAIGLIDTSDEESVGD